MLICSSDWRTRYFAPCYDFFAVERITAAIASSWLCFQAIWKRLIISRKRLKVFILKTCSERVSVCAELWQCPCRGSCCQLSTVLPVPAPGTCSRYRLPGTSAGWFQLLSGKGCAAGSRQCAELADPRTGRIHSIQVSVRIARYKRKQQPYSPEVCPLSRDTDWTSDDCSRGF